MLAEDADGIDSLLVTVDSVVRVYDGGFDRVFSVTYRFVEAPGGRNSGDHVPVTFRARDGSGFVVQRDTYVVVVP